MQDDAQIFIRALRAPYPPGPPRYVLLKAAARLEALELHRLRTVSNPDVHALTAHIERLEAALREIAERSYDPASSEAARAALGDAP